MIKWIAVRHLRVNKDIGYNALVQAYEEIYGKKQDMPVCKFCGKPIPMNERGRKRRFCSDVCRAKYNRQLRRKWNQKPKRSVRRKRGS